MLAPEEIIELGGRDIFVAVIEDEDKVDLIYITTIDTNVVLGILQVDELAQIDVYRSTLDSIIASLRYDPDAAPTSNFSTGPAELGEGAFVYYQNLTVAIILGQRYNILGSPSEIIQMPDGTVLVTNRESIFALDVETGTLDRVLSKPNSFIIDELVAAPDGNLWGYDFIDGLVKLSPNLETLLSTGKEVFGEDVFVDNIAVDAAGNVYVFDSVRDEENNATGTVFIFNDAGEFQGSFITNEEPDEYGITSFDTYVWLFPQDDGNILLIDDFLYSKVVDTEGNLVSGPFQYGDQFNLIFARDIDVADDGTLFALTNDGTLRKYAPSGELIAEVGTEQEDDDSPWVLGELPSFGGAILALDSNRVLVVGSNSNYSLLTLVDFSRLEAE
ncbi:MAG: hypothetical protein CUN55_14945 [Phototrophicales bacterium]|nr:MAG: hypothetical protein CUN55_14945 [Phototrophicales bacterium]